MTNHNEILHIPDPYPTLCYCWGSGVSGCTLGIGSGKISLRPIQINIRSSTSIISVAAGFHRTVAINYRGECYSWGKPPLGRKTSSITAEAKVKRIILDVPITKVSHGEHHSLLLAIDGSIYSYGDAKDGKLGILKKTRGQVILPSKVSVQKKCVDITCGFAHTTLLMENDTLCYCGKTGINRSASPYIYNIPKKLVSISSGSSHFAAISSEFECYTWGLTTWGRLGHGDYDGEDFIDCIENSPKRVEYFVNNQIIVAQLACGGSHTCVISKDGKVYAFGWNVYSQCGVSPCQCVVRPVEVDLKGRCIVDISCGFAHTTVIDELGNLLAFGMNEDGQLGIGHENNVHEPTVVQFNEEDSPNPMFTIGVSAGKTHTVCIRSNCMPYKFKERLKEIADKERAINVLSRFRDHILQKIRASKLMKKLTQTSPSCSEDKIFKDFITTAEKEDETSAYGSISSSDDSSSLSDIQVDPIPKAQNDVQRNIDECIRQAQENEFMKLEDTISRQTNIWRNEYFEKLRKKKKKLINEILRRYEIFSMAKADRYSRAFFLEQKEDKMEQKKITYLQMVSSRDSRTYESIKKETDRMLKAKQKPKKNSKLPKKSKFVPNVNKSDRKYQRKNALNTNDKLTVATFDNSERNRRLLKRREKRLLREERIRREELERRDLQHNVEDAKNQSLNLLMNTKIASYLTDIEKFLLETKVKKTFDLIHLRKSIGISNHDNNGEHFAEDDNGCRAKSVAQWTNDLAL